MNRLSEWMDYQLGTLWPAFKDAVLGLIRIPPEQRDQTKIEASVQGTAGVLAILDAHLEHHEYVAGSSLTMGDVALGSSVYRWLNLDIDRPQLSKLQAWHTRLEERPPYRRTVMVPFTKEDPAQIEE